MRLVQAIALVEGTRGLVRNGGITIARQLIGDNFTNAAAADSITVERGVGRYLVRTNLTPNTARLHVGTCRSDFNVIKWLLDMLDTRLALVVGPTIISSAGPSTTSSVRGNSSIPVASDGDEDPTN